MIGADTSFLVHAMIEESGKHQEAHRFLREHILSGKERLGIAPQVLTEFLHIVTDGNRFERPLTMEGARAQAELWWEAKEVVKVYPDDRAVHHFLNWMKEYRLGRKRLLDTMLSATYCACGITKIVTTDFRDFRTFGSFEVITI